MAINRLMSLFGNYRVFPQTSNENLNVQLLSGDWQKETQSVLRPDLAPDRLIQALSLDSELANCFSLDAGVKEGYTVGEHTKRVLEMAQRYRESSEKLLPEGIHWSDFLLFLALHDIGKGIAKQEQAANDFSTVFSFKQSELTHTTKIMKSKMHMLGLDERTIDFFASLLLHDAQGAFLKGDISRREVFNNVLQMARASHLDPISLYRTFELFHRLDAASYPALLQSIFRQESGNLKHIEENQKKIDSLMERFQSIEEGKRRFQEIVSMINSQEPIDFTDVKTRFTQALNHLSVFLEATHNQMLALEVSEENREVFRSVKRGFRDIILFFSKASPSTQSAVVYENLLNRLGSTENGQTYSCWVEWFTTTFSVDNINTSDIQNLIISLQYFRCDYLMRYSESKVLAKMRGNASSQIFKLQKINFLHGANSGLLANLLLTQMRLLPSGVLLKYGIVPLSGELGEGILAGTGINRKELSGVSLAGGLMAVNYARNAGFVVQPATNYESRIKEFLVAVATRMQKINEENQQTGKENAILYRQIEEDFIGRASCFESKATVQSRINLEYEEKKQKDLTFYAVWDDNDRTLNRLSYFYLSDHYYNQSGLSELIVNIKRLRVLSPEKLEKMKPELEKAILNIKEGFNSFKESEEYQKRMRNDYWRPQTESIEQSLKEVEKALIEAVVAPRVSLLPEKPYGMVFGSETILCYPVAQNCFEQGAPKALALGEDIQHIFVEDENRAHLDSYLESNGAQRVTVHSMSVLTQAIAMNRQVLPYLFDIGSSKKMKTIAETKKEN